VPILGRTFTASEGVAVINGENWESPHVAILSYGYWRQHYGASSDAIGKVITVNQVGEKDEYTIVGVMPKGFDFPYPLDTDKPDMWINDTMAPGVFNQGNDLQVLGRLKPGVSLAQAQAEINTIAERIRAEYPKYYKDEEVSVVPLSSELIRDVRSVLWVLLAAFTFILLIGCANVGNLLLVRAVSREKEMAIRATLGARRWVLIRQMLAEGMLLALAGGAGVAARLRESARSCRAAAAIDLHSAIGFRGAGHAHADFRGGAFGDCHGSVQRAAELAAGAAESE